MSGSVVAEVINVPAGPLDKTAEFFLNSVLDSIVQGPPPKILIAFSASPKRRLRIELRDIPGQADEILRALGAQEQATILALLHPAPVPDNVPADRCWILACEDGTTRLDTMVALRGDNGKGGAAQFQLLASASPSAPRWVGVAPSDDVQVWEMDGPVFMGPGGDA
jgi:hypothetical protein